jgi:ketol-acid reductoisomerase
MSQARVYTNEDADLALLEGKKIAVIGLGAQGFAHAQNLNDSGLNVVVGLREGSASHEKAANAGLKSASIKEAVTDADLVALLVPDMPQAEIYENDVAPHLKDGACLLFAHGLNIRFDLIKAPESVDVIMVAPKGPGDLVRETYQEGAGVPCIFAVEKNASGQAKELALSYAKGIGGTRAGAIETTFTEETETDLFGEQAVLCGGATALVLAGFETLCEAGYQPEIAYFECMHELKLIVDLMQRSGIKGMRKAISETAKYGDVVSGPRVIGDASKQAMKDILTEIQDGTFAKNWVQEYKDGMPNYKRLLADTDTHQLETTGTFLRSKMSWLQKQNDEKSSEA